MCTFLAVMWQTIRRHPHAAINRAYAVYTDVFIISRLKKHSPPAGCLLPNFSMLRNVMSNVN